MSSSPSPSREATLALRRQIRNLRVLVKQEESSPTPRREYLGRLQAAIGRAESALFGKVEA